MKQFYALCAVFCLWAITAYAFVMPTQPDAQFVLKNIQLGDLKMEESQLKLLPYPMIQDGYMGRADNSKALKPFALAKNEIALTFDDGPTPNTPQVLDILDKAGVKATFFLVGHNVQANPKMVIEILKRGHSVGNHTWNHKALPKLSETEAYNEIARTDDLLKRIVAQYNQEHQTETPLVIQPFFRFPEGAGAFDKQWTNIVGKFGFANFYWSMSVHDSRTDDPNIVFQIAVKDMLDKYNNGVILLHETRPWTREMLPYFLQVLKQRKYKTVYFQADPATLKH